MGSLLRFRRDDSGMALFVAMAAIVLMFLLTTTAFYFASQTLFEAKLADQHDVAFQAASSGVMVAFADLQAKLASLRKDVPYTYAGTIATSAASYAATATYNPASSVASPTYDCTSTGTAANGTTELVIASFTITPPSSSRLPYGYNVFYFGGSGVGSVNGNGTITGPYFVLYKPPVPPATFPTVAFGGSMHFSGGPIYIQNGNFSGNGTYGQPPVLVYTNGTVSGNYITRMPLEATASMSVTRVDANAFLASSLASATAQSRDNRMGDTGTTNSEVTSPSTTYLHPPGAPNSSSTAYKVIGTSSNPVGLTIPSAASFGNISGSVHDDFAYDRASSTLYVEGTVYIWGTLTISGPIQYVGNGTIVCSTGLEVRANVLPSTSDSLPDARHLLCVFTAGDISFPSNAVTCVGAFYAAGQVSAPKNNLVLKGSFVSELGINAGSNSLDITSIPGIGNYISPGMPYLVDETSGSGSSAGLRISAWRRQ